MAYVELVTTTNFTFLQGASHPGELVEAAADLGMGGIGITDRNSFSGVVRGYVAARDIQKKKPDFRYLVGVRLSFSLDQHTPEMVAYPNYHVCTHSGPLRLEMAIQRLGWNFDFYVGREMLADRMYCSICKKYHPTFRLGSKMPPRTYAGTHGAGAIVRSVLDVAVATSVPFKWAEPDDWIVGGSTVRKFGPRR